MNKIKIVEVKENETLTEMTEKELLNLFKDQGAIEVFKNYEVPEEFLMKWAPGDDEFEGIEKEIIIQMLQLSEDFIKSCITLEYFTIEDISELNMSTYSTLSEDFIKEYDEYINWERMILYLSSSEKITNISLYKNIIEKFQLWNLISANDLSIDFIRENKEKLDWRILSIVKNFSEEEIQEFKSEIPLVREMPSDQNFNSTPSVKDIRKIIKKSLNQELNIDKELENKAEEEELRFTIKHSIENLTKEDLENIKNYINKNSN